MTLAATSAAPALSEDAVHRAIVAHLGRRGRPGVWWCHVPNGGSRDAREAARMKGLGVQAGAPDLMVIIGGTTRFLELKRERGGRLSAAQRATHEGIRAAGAVVETAHGLDEALAVLERWGAIR